MLSALVVAAFFFLHNFHSMNVVFTLGKFLPCSFSFHEYSCLQHPRNLLSSSLPILCLRQTAWKCVTIHPPPLTKLLHNEGLTPCNLQFALRRADYMYANNNLEGWEKKILKSNNDGRRKRGWKQVWWDPARLCTQRQSNINNIFQYKNDEKLCPNTFPFIGLQHKNLPSTYGAQIISLAVAGVKKVWSWRLGFSYFWKIDLFFFNLYVICIFLFFSRLFLSQKYCDFVLFFNHVTSFWN